jgi:glutamyl-tRNA synthetase
MLTTRIAPSPTGYMHVGTARTALFCWLAARASGGRFILRIDDTDLDRNIDAAVQPIFDGLDWLGLDRDLTVRQSDRTDIYRQHANMLLDAGLGSLAGHLDR